MAKKELNNVKVENAAETKPDVNAAYAGLEIPERFKNPRTFVVAGVCRIEQVPDRDKIPRPQPVCRLLDPFNDEDFTSVVIIPKWANASGLFKYRAKKRLREVPEIAFPVFVTPVTYYSKKAKKELTVAGLFVPNPFDEGHIEFTVPTYGGKVSEDLAVFRMLASERWNMLLDELPVSDDEASA